MQIRGKGYNTVIKSLISVCFVIYFRFNVHRYKPYRIKPSWKSTDVNS